MKPSEERLRAALSAWELLWELDLSKRVPCPESSTRPLLKATFLAGVLHGYAEGNQDLEELERRLREAP